MYNDNLKDVYQIFFVLYTLLSFASYAVAEKPSQPTQIDHSTNSVRLLENQLIIKGKSITLPCKGETFIDYKEKIYVACAAVGAITVTIDTQGHPHISTRQNFGGSVTGFFVVNNQVWAKIYRVEAQPLSNKPLLKVESNKFSSSSVVTPASLPKGKKTTSPSVSKTHTTLGKVISIRSDSIIISLGQKEGVKIGSFIELFSLVKEDLGAGERTTRKKVFAIGVVKAASTNRSIVKLGLGESAPKGSLARITNKKSTHNLNIPPRSAGYWEIIANFRPFLALGTLGFGTIADGSIGYRGKNGLHMMFLVEPFGFALAEDGNVLSSALSLVAGYDTQIFEVGLGLGMAAINDDIDSPTFEIASESDSVDNSRTPTFERVRSGLSIMQTIRLGALDGLHLNAHNMFIFHKSEFKFGGINIRAQLPLSNRSWLLARGGGGVSGYGYGEIALKVLVKGNGDRGSLFLTPSLGGGGVFGETEKNIPANECYSYMENGKCIKEVSYAGPMIGIGVEWRL
jgi:hypothetical protein